jgi:hypothetical protein
VTLPNAPVETFVVVYRSPRWRRPGIAAQGGAGRHGHSSIQITADRYGHLFPRGDDSAELAATEKAFLGNQVIMQWSTPAGSAGRVRRAAEGGTGSAFLSGAQGRQRWS